MATPPPDKAPDKPAKKADPGSHGSDVAYFGDIDVSKDYPPGTHFTMPDGEEVDVSTIPDIIGGEAQPPSPGPGIPPQQQKPTPQR